MRTIISAAVLLALANTGVAAPDFTDTAQVVSSTPIVDRITEPRQDCGPAQAAPAQERSVVAPIVGGVAGAVIGNQVGRGSGRTAATAVGAIAGAVVGDRIGNAPAQAAPAQQCRTVETTRDVVRGYTVVYRYNGRDITTTLPYNPGSTVRVGIGVVDNAPQAAAPTAGMMGSNVRDVSPSTPSDYGPTPVSNPGGYQYRY